MKVPFSPPDISELEIEEVVSALRSGWITTGPKTKELERLVASYCGVNRAVCLNSQTACAEMALRLLGVGEGDEVITSAYTYTASASVVCHVGAKVVLADIDKDGFNIDYDKVASLISEKTKVIIPVDIAGIPCDYDRLYKIVNEKKHLFKPSNELQEKIGRIVILADTAHSFGAERGGVKTGALADFSAFSFHAVKNLTTAEGGALCWKDIEGVDNEDIYRKLQLFSLHGQNKDALAKTKLGAWEYDIVGTWYKCNMTDVAAGIGLAQMRRYEGILARRKEIVNKYDKAFNGKGITVLEHYTDSYSSSGHLYITRVDGIDEDKRNAIITEMAKRDIACNVHYKPLPMHTAYKSLGFDIKNYPSAYEHYKNEITLPLHTCLSDEQVEYVIENFLQIIGDIR
ncbi:MAG: DegT/DnrJ/EryC1/StrS family aminotransferase [Clostridia bacterium]|nr:DegT/DnrJ/EryC1/StrS family aminotransferase [Clostridia bacterium]